MAQAIAAAMAVVERSASFPRTGGLSRELIQASAYRVLWGARNGYAPIIPAEILATARVIVRA